MTSEYYFKPKLFYDPMIMSKEWVAWEQQLSVEH